MKSAHSRKSEEGASTGAEEETSTTLPSTTSEDVPAPSYSAPEDAGHEESRKRRAEGESLDSEEVEAKRKGDEPVDL